MVIDIYRMADAGQLVALRTGQADVLPPPPPPPPAGAGLHYNSFLLGVWADRFANGPYKTAGDSGYGGQYSPGDGVRIVSAKNAFLSNPSNGMRWNTSNLLKDSSGYVTTTTANMNNLPPTTGPSNLLCAAFWALVHDDTAVKQQVVSEILGQVGVLQADSRTRPPWPYPWPSGKDGDWSQNPMFDVAIWLNKLTYAWDYAKGAATQAQKEQFYPWLYGWASMWGFAGHSRFMNGALNGWFNNRWTQDWNHPRGCVNYHRHFDNGPFVSQHSAWGVHNRWSSGAEFMTAAALLLQNEGYVPSAQANPAVPLSYMLDTAEQWVRDFVGVYLFPFGSFTEFYRATHAQSAAVGWSYVATTVGNSVAIADMLDRAGRTAAKTFGTRKGTCGSDRLLAGPYYDTAPEAAPDTGETAKSVHYAGRTVARYWHKFYSRTVNGQQLDGAGLADDLRMLPQGLRMWQDTMIRDTARRSRSGTNPWPANPPGSRGHNVSMMNGQYPGLALMFLDTGEV
jgi:hypothetical protein